MIRRLQVASGEPSDIMALAEGIQPAWPVWSPDAEQLAFLEVANNAAPSEAAMQTRSAATEVAATAVAAGSPPPPEIMPTDTPSPPPTTRVRVVSAADGATRFLLPTRSTGERPVAFSPDGRLLAVIELAASATAEGPAVAIHALGANETDQPLARWGLPAGAFFFDWLPPGS